MPDEKFFPRAYGLKTQAEITELYTDWAKTYDKEVIESGYETPRRCAEALSKFAEPNAPILDFGCGTGLSGDALAHVGFTNIHGSEVNPQMRAIAKSRGIYQGFVDASLKTPFPFAAGKFAAMSAVGVISSGAAPASLLPAALNALAPDGLLVLSFNDHTLTMPEYTDALSLAQSSGTAKLIFEEYGAHLTKKRVGATVYVLRRL